MKQYRWEDIFLGLKHGFDAVLSQEIIGQFAALSGDFNPLHTDRAYAQAMGYSDSVVFGMLSSAFYSRLVGMYLPGQFALLQGIDIDLNSPCFPGEALHVEGEVSYLNEAYKRFEIRARIRKDDRSLVSKCTIRVGFHE